MNYHPVAKIFIEFEEIYHHFHMTNESPHYVYNVCGYESINNNIYCLYYCKTCAVNEIPVPIYWIICENKIKIENTDEDICENCLKRRNVT